MLAFAPLLLAAIAGAFAPDSLFADLQRAGEGVDHSYSAIHTATGADTALSLSSRLTEDAVSLRQPIPEGYGTADWRDALGNIVRLDVDAATQASNGTWASLSAEPGLHEAFVRSSSDGTLQPVAVYVPQTISEGARAPLVIALHGRPQTETELLGPPFLRRLADRTGSIVVAPFGRAAYDFAEPAATDVYDLVAEAQKRLPVDPGRTYLFGYSMGGFSVFKIGPRGGKLWAAAMCVSGAILNSETRLVRYKWSGTPLYVVTGTNDTSIPAAYGEQTAAFLASAGLPVSFYEEPLGTHSVRTLVPSLQRAWLDMHAGTVRGVPNIESKGVPLLGSPPSGTTKSF